jgi:phospholipid/cholesterol/gamma-HCH transport system substrate-binding protein
MFNRSTGEAEPGDPWYCQVVISASRDIESADQNAIVNQVADELRQTSKDARAVIATVKDPAAEFAKVGLPRLTAAIETLEFAAQSFDRLTAEAEKNPRGLITKAPAKELEVRQ